MKSTWGRRFCRLELCTSDEEKALVKTLQLGTVVNGKSIGGLNL